MKAYGGPEVYLHSFLIPILNRTEWSDSHPGLPMGKETPVPIEYDSQCAPEPVWTLGEERKSNLDSSVVLDGAFLDS